MTPRPANKAPASALKAQPKQKPQTARKPQQTGRATRPAMKPNAAAPAKRVQAPAAAPAKGGRMLAAVAQANGPTKNEGPSAAKSTGKRNRAR